MSNFNYFYRLFVICGLYCYINVISNGIDDNYGGSRGIFHATILFTDHIRSTRKKVSRTKIINLYCYFKFYCLLQQENENYK